MGFVGLKTGVVTGAEVVVEACAGSGALVVPLVLIVRNRLVQDLLLKA